MVFSAILTLVKLLVLCTVSRVVQPSQLSRGGIAMACTHEMLQGRSTQESLAITLAPAVCLSPQLLLKTHCGKKTQRSARETWAGYTQQGLRFPKQVWDSWHGRRQRHMKQHVLVNLEGSQVLPELSTKPHTHVCAAALAVSLLWVWIGQLWPKPELCLVPLNFGAERKSKDLMIKAHGNAPRRAVFPLYCPFQGVTHTWASWFKGAVAVGPWLRCCMMCVDTPVTDISVLVYPCAL